MSTRAEGQQARVLARLYCPPAQRAALEALLGIESEVRAGLERALEHELAHARLAWWREECARLAAGHPLHPLTRELQARFGEAGRDALAGLSGFIDTATWDLAAAPFETRRELEAYCGRWSAAGIEPLVSLALPDTAAGFARPFGCALRELELLNRLSVDARHGRLRLPLHELAAAGVPPEEPAALTLGAALAELLRRRHRQARSALAQAIAGLAGAQQGPLRALLVWASMVALESRRIAAALPRATSPSDHHAPLDGARAWRAARRADAGRFSLGVD